MHSAAHLSLHSGISLHQQTLFHRGEAIRLVTGRMTDPKHRTSDATILAIASLSIFEVSSRRAKLLSEFDLEKNFLTAFCHCF